MSTSFPLQTVVRRGLQGLMLAGAGLGVASAQTQAAPSTAAAPIPFQAAAAPAFSSSLSTPAYSSSAASAEGYDPAQAAQTQMASLEKNFGLPGANAMQYGQRRRYGAPRYRGGNTNPDGSEKYTGYAGAGFAVPGTDKFNYATTSWGFQVGAGRNFNQHFGTMLEFDYDHFGMSGGALRDQQNLYNYIIAQYNAQVPVDQQASSIAGLDGNNHIWSFSLDPVYNIKSGEGLGAYVIGGVGFYHKVANFTVPTQGEYCDYYYGCYGYVANQVIDHYTSNAFGVNGGVGFTYKFSRFANQRLYGEVRYVYTFNSARPGVTYATVTPGNASAYNDFPQNSNRTGYLPVKLGIRF